MARKIWHKILFILYKIYWFIFRPSTFGVKCVIENNGEILMIQNSYGRKRWTFPGGKIEKGESKENAAKRESKEEVNIDILDIKFIGEFISTAESKKDTIYCFSAKSKDKNFNIETKEIMIASWISLENLPEPLAPITEKILDLYKISI